MNKFTDDDDDDLSRVSQWEKTCFLHQKCQQLKEMTKYLKNHIKNQLNSKKWRFSSACGTRNS